MPGPTVVPASFTTSRFAQRGEYRSYRTWLAAMKVTSVKTTGHTATCAPCHTVRDPRADVVATQVTAMQITGQTDSRSFVTAMQTTALTTHGPPVLTTRNPIADATTIQTSVLSTPTTPGHIAPNPSADVVDIQNTGPTTPGLSAPDHITDLTAKFFNALTKPDPSAPDPYAPSSILPTSRWISDHAIKSIRSRYPPVHVISVQQI